MTASHGKKALKVVLVGQPNVGKSCLLNALVGPCVTISNYPGTTVETTQAVREIGETFFKFRTITSLNFALSFFDSKI